MDFRRLELLSRRVHIGIAILLLAVYSGWLTYNRFSSPSVPEDLSTLFPNYTWDPLLDGWFAKHYQTLDVSFMSAIPWGAVHALIDHTLRVEYWPSLILIGYFRFMLMLLLLYAFFRQFRLSRLLTVVAIVLTQSTLALSEVFNHSPRYSSVTAFLALSIFTMRMTSPRSSSTQIKFTNWGFLALALILVPGAFSNLANALVILAVIPCAMVWARVFGYPRSKAFTFSAIAVALATLPWLPLYLWLLRNSPFEVYSLNVGVEFFRTTSALDVLEGRGAWWERSYLPWSSELDHSLRRATRIGLTLFTVAMVLLGVLLCLRSLLSRARVSGMIRVAGRFYRWGIQPSTLSAAFFLLFVSIFFYRILFGDGSQRFLGFSRWPELGVPTGGEFLVQAAQVLLVICITATTLWRISRSNSAKFADHQRSLIISFGVVSSGSALLLPVIGDCCIAISAVALLLVTITSDLRIVEFCLAIVTCLGIFTVSPTLGLLALAWALLAVSALGNARLGLRRLAALGVVPGILLILLASQYLYAQNSNIVPRLEQIADKDNSYRAWILDTSPECPALIQALQSTDPWMKVGNSGKSVLRQCPEMFIALARSGGPTGEWVLWNPHGLWDDYLGFLAAHETPFQDGLLSNSSIALMALFASFVLGLITKLSTGRPIAILLAIAYPLMLCSYTLSLEWLWEPRGRSLGAVFTIVISLAAVGLGSILCMSVSWLCRRSFVPAKKLLDGARMLVNTSGTFRDFRTLVVLAALSGCWLILTTWLWSALLYERFPPALAFREPWSKFAQFFVIYWNLCIALALGIAIRLASQVSAKVRLASGACVVLVFTLIVNLEAYVRVSREPLQSTPIDHLWAEAFVDDLNEVKLRMEPNSEGFGVCILSSQNLSADILYGRWMLGSLPNVRIFVEGIPGTESSFTQLGRVVRTCALDAPRALSLCVNSKTNAPGHRGSCDYTLPQIGKSIGGVSS